MKVLKILLYTLAALLGIYLILCLLGPSEVKFERSVKIQAPVGKVFDQVANFQNWPNWSPWSKEDPAMTNTYGGTPATVGHRTDWKSKKMGDGSQELVEVTPNEALKIRLAFSFDPEEPLYVSWKFSGDSTQTQATWQFDSGHYSFFQRGMMYVIGMQSMMEGYYDRGLADLKKVSEQ